ncbi:hypothetical protein EV196_11239 [Mariniflexile fucanivorans]|uniref:Septum formation inhibitor Maf n=1 Tax=Mariniflexile fucanivorans TaxID=264023 RepID=A0A4R1RB28_9FLAO|nr:septum formation inhibitor Maf [Mariniflexile fucanivorans]TCL62642.1 hypothetical protein EV196_11239 [Mariniflexile fucanivorans]
MKLQNILVLNSILLLFIVGCSNNSPEKNNIAEKSIQQSEKFNAYWYNNEAEITSYKLEQARYGEIHPGKATLIFVTEPFSRQKQVKADNPIKEDYSVLKLNFTKNFITGIYPYSMMTSSFTPVNYPDAHASKTTTSSQEWCGHTYTQINNKNKKYTISVFSYFEDEGDQKFELKEAWLEDEIWSKIRLNPDLLPTGKIRMIPSSFYVRLMHKELKAYQAEITKTKIEDDLIAYKISYKELDRELTINYKNSFPYPIESWEETYISGWGDKAQKLTTKATKLKRIKLDYWTKNKVENSELRKQLELN